MRLDPPLLLLLLAPLAGCTGGLNTSDELLGAEPFPALAPAVLEPPVDEGPSLHGLDRRNWPLVVVSSPPGQVEYLPTYVHTIFPDESLPRDRGEFPVRGEVLDTFGDPGAEFVEGAANLPYGPLQILVAPVEMVAKNRWPWTVMRSWPDYELEPRTMPRDPWVWVTPPGAANASGASDPTGGPSQPTTPSGSPPSPPPPNP